MSPLNLNTVLKPPHVTFDSHGPYHRSSVRSVLDFLGSGELDSVFDQKHHRRRHSQGQSVYEEDVIFPNFTVRETAEAYFLEGDFPGIRNPNDIRIERLGSHGLHIEAQAPELDLYHEWGDIFGVRPRREVRFESGAEQGTTTEGSPNREHEHGHKHDHAEANEGEKPHGDKEGKGAARPNKARRRESSSHAEDDEPTTTTTLLSERHAGRLLRSFTFPQTVDLDGMKARLKDGVLRIALPKASVHERRSSYKIEYGG
ncbi:uncharacterized protein Z520_05032 [Fonsecaea multimorphosa CBS 102226]|uniref:SHSP domain-containing protein n=1 Tax=Fonsecaea multimorphosa CBS 102226 TaxID=1442371 RepID=A0A0D2IR53_9EURO|nr:uncharacterized protein Z520_05032 [Fonsecaea multimorphosa CBS 102226]KIX99456.1 hypothetical protein Z520_05032 [Fonsecaea multimorphosa CBS 102226]OAL25781.1 hypothetical protein AYO22_04770 [Fonsecaea multimorphosa]